MNFRSRTIQPKIVETPGAQWGCPLFGNFRKCCSIGYRKLPKIQTGDFGWMESAPVFVWRKAGQGRSLTRFNTSKFTLLAFFWLFVTIVVVCLPAASCLLILYLGNLKWGLKNRSRKKRWMVFVLSSEFYFHLWLIIIPWKFSSSFQSLGREAWWKLSQKVGRINYKHYFITKVATENSFPKYSFTATHSLSCNRN